MHRVFVYGTLKRGQGNFGRLEAATFCGDAVTVAKYWMLDGGFPVVLELPEGEEGHPVKGEVFEVNDAELADLDRLEGYRGEGRHNMYDRKIVEVQIEGGPVAQVFMYIGAGRWGDRRNANHMKGPSAAGQLEWFGRW
ncbi:gamma-glutamylcyclotransferase family protein [Bradyrhizobium sp. RT10b]|uniref:gamma-glutamylcyclotransferase family protein n=1 Tax=Bradyrhizobium sp. RT10b TaxID=3156331 RepID=UPI0033911925